MCSVVTVFVGHLSITAKVHGPKDRDRNPPDSTAMNDVEMTPERPPDPQDEDSPMSENPSKSKGKEPECLLFESAGAESESPSNLRESEVASLPKTQKSTKPKRSSTASVSGHPQGKETRPNNKKKKKKRKGEDSFHIYTYVGDTAWAKCAA